MPDFVPKIDDAIIHRLIERDFGPYLSDRVRELLSLYGPKPHHIEPHRVQAAVLRIAKGDIAELQRQLSVAVRDFRDVLSEAEYPSQMKPGFTGMGQIDAQSLQELREKDWRDYSDWLSRL